jgi:hypothetical protein
MVTESGHTRHRSDISSPFVALNLCGSGVQNGRWPVAFLAPS